MLGSDTVAGLRVRIGADVRDFQKTAQQMEKAIKPVADKMRQIGQSLSLYVTAPLLGAAGASIRLAGDLEQARTNFEVMLGSAQRASAFLKDLERFAATTPFEFSELIGASEKLLAFGFSAEKVVPMLTTIGDAARGSAEKIDRITVALGQIQAKGKVSTEEVLQLTEAGIPAFEILQEKLGLTTKQMENLGNAGISAESAIAALLEGLDERFGGTMERSASNINLLFSNVFDNIKLLATDLGDALIETFNIKDLLRAVIDGLGSLRDRFAALRESNPMLVKLGLALAAVAAAAGPLLVTLGAIAQAIPFIAAGFGALTGPIGLAVAGLAALTAGAAVLFAKWDTLGPLIEEKFPGALDFLGRRFEALAGTVQTTMGAVVRVLSDSYANMLDGLDAFSAAYKGDWQTFWEEIANIPQRYIKMYYDAVIGAANAIRKPVNELRKSLLGIKDPVDPGSAFSADQRRGINALLPQPGFLDLSKFENLYHRLGEAGKEAFRKIKEGAGGAGGVLKASAAEIDRLHARIKAALTGGEIGEFFAGRWAEGAHNERVWRGALETWLGRRPTGAGPENMPVSTPSTLSIVGMPAPEEVAKLKAAIDAATPSITAAHVASAEWGSAMRRAITDASEMMVDGLSWAIGDAIAGFESLGKSVKRIMQQVIASIMAAVARVIILKTLLSIFGGGGFFGGIISSVARDNGVVQGWGKSSGLVSSSAVSGGSVRSSQAIAVQVVPTATVLPSGDLRLSLAEGTRRQVAGVLG